MSKELTIPPHIHSLLSEAFAVDHMHSPCHGDDLESIERKVPTSPH